MDFWIGDRVWNKRHTTEMEMIMQCYFSCKKAVEPKKRNINEHKEHSDAKACSVD